MKRISLVLVLTMMLAFANIPVNASNTDNEANDIFSEDFNSLTTDTLRTTYSDALKTVNADSSTATDSASYYEVSDGAMALNMKTTHSSITFKKSLGIISSGKVGISLKVKPASGVTSSINLKINNAAATFFIALIDSSGNVNLGASTNTVGTITLEQWVDLSAVLDFENDKAYIMLTDTSGTVLSDTVDFDANNITEFDIGQYQKTEATMYVDDIDMHYIPVQSGENIVYSENFDGLSTTDFITESISGLTSGKTSCYTIENGELNITSNDTANVAWFKAWTPVEGGKIGYKFRMTPASGVTTRAVLKTKNNAGTFFVCCVDTSGNVSLGAASGTDITLSSGNYCDITAVFNYDTKKVSILYSDEGGKTAVKTVDFIDNGSNEAPNINGLQFQQWGKANTVLKVDNISLYTNAAELPTAEAVVLPVEETFEGYTENTFMVAGSSGESKGNYGGTVSGHVVGQKVIESEEESHGKVLQYDASVMTDTTTAAVQYTRTISGTKDDVKLESGTVKYSADVKIINEWPFYIGFRGVRADTEVVGSFPLLRFSGGKIYYGTWSGTEATKIGEYVTGGWCHIEGTVNIKEAKATVKVTNADRTAIGEKSDFALTIPAAPTSVSDLIINFDGLSTAGNTGKAWIDNAKIEYVSVAPQVTADSVTIYEGETLQADKASVSPASDKLVIDFGANTRIAFNSIIDGVKLTDSDGKEIAFSGHLNGNLYTLTLGESLEPSTTYTLKLSENISDIDGDELGSNVSVLFTTNSGGLSVTFDNIKMGDTEVTELTQVAKDNVITSNIAVKNTSADEQSVTVIYCYYSADDEGAVLLKACKISTLDIESGADKVIADNHTIEDLTDISKISVLVWDGFENLKPLTLSRTID